MLGRWQSGRKIDIAKNLLSNMVDSLKEIGTENIEKGDILLSNDSYFGGSHFPDLTLMKPIFSLPTAFITPNAASAIAISVASKFARFGSNIPLGFIQLPHPRQFIHFSLSQSLSLIHI